MSAFVDVYVCSGKNRTDSIWCALVQEGGGELRMGK